MSRRAAVLVAAGSISLALLAGCDSGEPGVNSNAFTGPLTNDLIARASTDCGNGQIGPGDTLTVSGSDYLPDAVITMRWTVLSASETGTWPSVTADQNGRFSVPLKITRPMANPGETITVTSQGPGQTGVTMLSTDVVMGDC